MKAVLLICLLLQFMPVLYAQEKEIKLSLDKLFNLKVTSVSGTAMDLKKSPAAIYVLTSKDFKEQGHRTLPDALRSVPGFHVRKLNSNNWAISARGFNGRFANKLLVMIDGRSVYTPLFAGVYWEIQDLAIEDIARIEVIRGPGATLWGANAVNGVINIVTKEVRDTEGGYLKLGTGTVDPYESNFRYGFQSSENTFMKVWGKNFSRGESESATTGLSSNDSWNGGHYGMKLDWYATPKDTHNFQVNFSSLNVGTEADVLIRAGEIPNLGALNARLPLGTPLFEAISRRSQDANYLTGSFVHTWTRNLNSTDGFALKTYYDFTKSEWELFSEKRATIDVDFRHWLDWNENNSFIWGLSFRTTKDLFKGSDNVMITPEDRRLNTYSMFLQNTTRLSKKLSLMYGSKIEWNTQTGAEFQPSIRLTYEYTPETIFWASWARAVRRPSRAEDDVQLFQGSTNLFPDLGAGFEALKGKVIGGYLSGNREVDSEELIAWEAGTRTNFFNKKVEVDLAVFYNDYSHLINLESENNLAYAQTVDNDEHANAYGVEASVKIKATEKLDMMFN